MSDDARAHAQSASPEADQPARARTVELASLRAWPALQDSDFDGWRLRFANGYTRRSNSVTPLESSRLALNDKVSTCERLYEDQGLRTIFRMTPFAPPDLDGELAERGYRRGDEVEVRVRRLVPDQKGDEDAPGEGYTGIEAPHPRPRGRLRVCTLDRWLVLFERLSGAAPSTRLDHRAILERVPGRRRLLVFEVDGAGVACGLAVLLEGRLGLFDLVTSRDQRNRGYGSEMLRRTLQWGRKAGALEAYLQVLTGNAVARRLYERAGFDLLYRYHYREQS